MKKKILGSCPICSSKLYVSELKCPSCDTTLQGEFTLSKFDYLTPDQQNFALIFLKNAGNIKLVEKDLNISYPTVKKMLEEVISALGLNRANVVKKLTREEVLRMLKDGEIDFEEAESILKELNK